MKPIFEDMSNSSTLSFFSVALTVEGNMFTGSLESLCEVRDERRQNYEIYLQFLIADCGGDDPLVDCSCCVCLA